MPCSRAHRPSVIARSPMRTRNEEPTAIPRDFETPGAMRGEVERSACSRVGGGAMGEGTLAGAAGLPLPLPLPLPDLLPSSSKIASCPSPNESRSSGGGEGGAKLSILGASTASPPLTDASTCRELGGRGGRAGMSESR
jgi:hypothetical protein